MAQMTITPKNASAARVKDAAKIIKDAKAAGLGSNRTDWVRTTAVLQAVLQVIASGLPVEVTEAFSANMGGSAPAYNLLHRVLGSAPLRPYWHQVQALALVNVVEQGAKITGDTNTQAKRARLFVCPVE